MRISFTWRIERFGETISLDIEADYRQSMGCGEVVWERATHTDSEKAFDLNLLTDKERDALDVHMSEVHYEWACSED